jgi:hypothetical protein
MNTELVTAILKIALGEQPQPQQLQNPSGQHIVVLDRGFVYVGEITVDAEWVRIERARNIRIWGTKNGLGELRNGPLSDTKLDECEVVLAPRKSLISLIPCKGF